MPNASLFVKNRTDVISITNDRIKHILWYVTECYKLLIGSVPLPVYSKSSTAAGTTHKFEDYLKFEFVDKFLVKNKFILQGEMSGLEEVSFNCETQKRYIDSKDSREKPDKIDICINKLGLQKLWNEPDEHVYFAIECKRIKDNSSYTAYVKDIQKMCERNHTNLRLPFEGMIGFIEDPKITHTIASGEITKRLRRSRTIITIKGLTGISLSDAFEGSYLSLHKKNFKPKSNFELYHLLFDYSGCVVD